jgi:hypothetical protein
MSATVGTEVPEQVARLFDGTDLASKLGLGFLMVTVDKGGRPRPCMLSAGEVLVTGPETVRLGVWSGTSTARNLENGSDVLFCFVVPGTVCYLRGRARPLRCEPEARLDCFELAVESVETDSHAGLPVTSGITFTVTDPDPETVLATWTAQLNAIRDAEPAG